MKIRENIYFSLIQALNVPFFFIYRCEDLQEEIWQWQLW